MSRATDHIDAALSAIDEVLTQGCQCPACGGEEDFDDEIESEASGFATDLPPTVTDVYDGGTGISNAELFGDQDGPHPHPTWAEHPTEAEIQAARTRLANNLSAEADRYHDHNQDGIPNPFSPYTQLTEALEPTPAGPILAGTLTAHQHRMQPVEQWRLDAHYGIAAGSPTNNPHPDDPYPTINPGEDQP